MLVQYHLGLSVDLDELLLLLTLCTMGGLLVINREPFLPTIVRARTCTSPKFTLPPLCEATR